MSKKATQLTIRGFDPDLQDALRRLAEHEGISLNRAALKLMRRGAGLGPEARPPERIGNRLDHLMGTWSEADEREFLEATEEFERIDDELWR
ncbi:MAG: antitoxin [Planctomycetota bacterium]|jgi:hypothetical protein